METQLNIFCNLATLFCIARFIDMMKVIFILGKLPTFQTLEKEKENDLILIFLGTQTFSSTNDFSKFCNRLVEWQLILHSFYSKCYS